MRTAKQRAQIGTPKAGVPDRGRAVASRRYKSLREALSVVKYVVLLAFALIFILPFIWNVFWALKTELEIGQNPFSPPVPPHWENLPKVWTQGRFSKYVPNTLMYASTITSGICFLACLAGYGLAQISFPGRRLIFNFLLVGLMVPFFSLMIPLYTMIRDFGILGTRLGLIIPGIGLGVPFGTFLMRSFFLSLPKELGDAARIDGCNQWGVFSRVMLPLAGPGLTTLAVFEFMWSWNMFMEPLLFVQRDELRPVGLAIYFFQGRYTTDRGMVAAGVLLTIAPVIILYLLLQHRFIEGVTAGALK